jgi:hypothetical protein
MLLQLEITNKENINKLMAYARQHRLKLTILDKEAAAISLPGKPLTPAQLAKLITRSRKSGIISMVDAHHILRNNFHAD